MVDRYSNSAALSADLALVAAGDTAALRRVYERTFAKLFSICLRVLGDRAAVEDALQDVYFKVWLSASTFDPRRSSPITWLGILARNTAIDLRRATARRDAAKAQLCADGELVPSVLDSDREDLHGELRACLDQLEDPPRVAMHSAFFQGFSYSELAARSDTPLGTMKGWIRRGLLQLRRCLDDAHA